MGTSQETMATIRLINTQRMKELIATEKFMYTLYGDDDKFKTWKDWVQDTANSATVQYNQTNNADLYDGFVLKIYCDTNTNTPTGSGCCLLEPTKGGFCLINATATTAVTHSITKAKYDTWLNAATPVYTFPTGTALADTSENDPFFELFDCTDSLYNYFTCYKFQMKDNRQVDGFPRFDPSTGSV